MMCLDLMVRSSAISESRMLQLFSDKESGWGLHRQLLAETMEGRSSDLLLEGPSIHCKQHPLIQRFGVEPSRFPEMLDIESSAAMANNTHCT